MPKSAYWILFVSILRSIGRALAKPVFWVLRKIERGRVSGAATLVVLLNSWLFATVPDGWLDKLTQKIPGMSVVVDEGDDSPRLGRTVFGPTALLYDKDIDRAKTLRSATLFGWSRNIIVTDQDLVPDKEDDFGETSLNFRGRDLKYAVLELTDMHRANFTKSDLSGASLRWANLEGARFYKATLSRVNFKNAKLQQVDMRRAIMDSAIFDDANLTGADLKRANANLARFRRARMHGVNMKKAMLNLADLEAADLSWGMLKKTCLHGARFKNAIMRFSYLRGSWAVGANFAGANLYGVDLNLSDARYADFRRANLKNVLAKTSRSIDVNRVWPDGPETCGVDPLGSEALPASLVFEDVASIEFTDANRKSAEVNNELEWPEIETGLKSIPESRDDDMNRLRAGHAEKIKARLSENAEEVVGFGSVALVVSPLGRRERKTRARLLKAGKTPVGTMLHERLKEKMMNWDNWFLESKLRTVCEVRR